MAESKTKAKDYAKSGKAKEAPKAAAPKEAAQPPVQPQVTLHAQYVKDLSFESPSSPEVFLNQPGQPNVEVAVNVASTALQNNHFEVVLKVWGYFIMSPKYFGCSLTVWEPLLFGAHRILN